MVNFDPLLRVSTLPQELIQIQNELFNLGAELAKSAENNAKCPVIEAEAIPRLEQEIDEHSKILAPLRNFILPGGHLANSQANVARSVCRRLERRLIQAREDGEDGEEIRSEVLIYVNRLSDWLFIVGRVVSQIVGVEEIKWGR